MGQKPSAPTSASRQIEGAAPPSTAISVTTPSPLPSSAEENPSTAKILPGAYLIRNKASGTVLHLLPPLDYEIGEHCDIVGWQQESTDLETVGRQVWWVEWDDVYQGYIFSNVNNRGVVLDVVGSKSGMYGFGGVGSGGVISDEKIVCARPRVKSMTSARSSRRSSMRSTRSMEVVRREDVLDGINGGNGMQLTQTTLGDRIRSQRWVLRRSSPTSECFSIHNLLNPSIALDLDWGKTQNGTKVSLCTKTGVNHQQWNFIIPPIPSMSPPIGSWVFLVNHKTNSFLHHTDINYPPACIKLPKWEGIGERREFWGLHWTFVLADDRVGQPKWYIKNRLTGTMLEHWGGRRKGDSVKADSYLFTESKEWKLELLPAGSPAEGKFKTGLWGLVNADSECALDHYGGKSVQAYSPNPMKDESRQWKIMEVAGPYVDFGAATLLSPPSLGPSLPTLSTSCTSLFPPTTANTKDITNSLQHLVMPSAAAFTHLLSTTWPFPACAPSSGDALAHEERSFFELLSRIETHLIIPTSHTHTHPPRSRRNTIGSIPSTPGSTSTTPPSPTTCLPPSRPRSTVFTLPMGFFDLVKQGKNLSSTSINNPGSGVINEKKPFDIVPPSLSKTTLTLITPAGATYLSLPAPPPAGISLCHTKKRILADAASGWSAWSLGFSPASGTISNWNSLVESPLVRRCARNDRYVVSFYEAVKIIFELLCVYFDNQSAILAASEGGESEGGVVVLPSRITWLVMLAGKSLERIVRLRTEGLGTGMGEVCGKMGWEKEMGEEWQEGRRVEEWVLQEMERVKIGWDRVEGVCRAGRPRGAFVY